MGSLVSIALLRGCQKGLLQRQEEVEAWRVLGSCWLCAHLGEVMLVQAMHQV